MKEKCKNLFLFTSDATQEEKVRIVNHNDGGFEITVQNCNCTSVTDYRLTSLPHGKTRLELIIELDNPMISIVSSTNFKT